jgi:hypothetical protein
MSVPKMVKKWPKFGFRIESRLLPQEKHGNSENSAIAVKAQKRIKTIFDQFRNAHAR